MAQIRGRDDHKLDLFIRGDLFEGVDDFQPLDPREIPGRGFRSRRATFEYRVESEEVRVGGDEGVVERLERETCGWTRSSGLARRWCGGSASGTRTRTGSEDGTFDRTGHCCFLVWCLCRMSVWSDGVVRYG